jgi:hypothetical protein
MEGACRDCGKTDTKLNAIGVCTDCERVRSEEVLRRLEEGRETITVAQLIEALGTAETLEEIYGLFAKCSPPTEPMEQARVREQLLRALKRKKLSSPTKLVDAWLNAAETEDQAVQTQASMLVDLVLQRDATLFHTSDQIAFAAVIIDGHREVLSLRSRAFRLWLGREYYEATAPEKPEVGEDGETNKLGAIFATLLKGAESRVPRAQAVVDALATLEGIATFDGAELPVYVRLAHVGDLVYLDLGNDAWEAIEISPSGWKIVATPPVMFRRPSGLGALPTPEPGGTIKDLRTHLNVEDAEWPLIVGAILGLFSSGPYAVIVFQGEQGAAKSTAARVIRAIVDPNTAPLRRKPRSDHDLAIAANNSWVLNFDNLSALPQWLSDAICTLATGGGFSARLLYSDDEERLFDSKRPVILNGIGTIATSSDLLDRAVLLTLPTIEQKTPEEEFWPTFYEALPRILGVVLDGVVAALTGAEDVKVSAAVRMVDFARFAMAGLPALGLDADEFIKAYAANQRDADLLALEASPIGKLVREFAEDRKAWEGTASDLLHELERRADEEDGVPLDREGPGQTRRSKAWPEQPHNLSHELRRMAPNLRRVGVGVEFDRTGSSRTIRITASVTPPDAGGGHEEAPFTDPEGAGEYVQNAVTGVTSVTPGTIAPPDDADDARDADLQTSGHAPGMDGSTGPPEGDGSPADGFHPGDIVRRLGGFKNQHFKVKAVVGSVVHCWEMEGDATGKLRSFPVGDLVLVRRGEEES